MTISPSITPALSDPELGASMSSCSTAGPVRAVHTGLPVPSIWGDVPHGIRLSSAATRWSAARTFYENHGNINITDDQKNMSADHKAIHDWHRHNARLWRANELRTWQVDLLDRIHYDSNIAQAA